MSVKLLKTAGEINKKLATAKKAGVTFQNAIQISMVSIAAHLAEHRDKTLVTNAWASMPNGSRRKLMVDWFEAHTQAVSIDYNSGAVELPAIDSPIWETFVADVNDIVETMLENPWYDHAKEKGKKDALTAKQIMEYLRRKANSKDADDTLKGQLSLIVAFAEETFEDK